MYISCSQGWWREKQYHSSALLLSQSWIRFLHSPSCRVKGFALTLGSTERDFLKERAISAQTRHKHSGTRTQRGTVFPARYRTDVSCSSLFKWIWRFGIAQWLDCDCWEWISWSHITTAHPHVVTYLFKFVFTSLFPLCMSRIYFVHMGTAAGLHPSCGSIIIVWTRRFSYQVSEIQHLKFIYYHLKQIY